MATWLFLFGDNLGPGSRPREERGVPVVPDHHDHDEGVGGQEHEACGPELHEDVPALEFEQVGPHQPVHLGPHPHQRAGQALPPQLHAGPGEDEGQQAEEPHEVLRCHHLLVTKWRLSVFQCTGVV